MDSTRESFPPPGALAQSLASAYPASGECGRNERQIHLWGKDVRMWDMRMVPCVMSQTLGEAQKPVHCPLWEVSLSKIDLRYGVRSSVYGS